MLCLYLFQSVVSICSNTSNNYTVYVNNDLSQIYYNRNKNSRMKRTNKGLIVSYKSAGVGAFSDHANFPSTTISDLPEEVARIILSYLSNEDIFWKMGMTCKLFLSYALGMVNKIGLPPECRKISRRQSSNADAVVQQLLDVLKLDGVSQWIRHAILLGKYPKCLRLLKKSLHELKGNL